MRAVSYLVSSYPRLAKTCSFAFAVFVSSAFLVGLSCGFSANRRGAGDTTQLLSGTDSAGATIEIEVYASGSARARVIDGVLGVAETHVEERSPTRISFEAHFPAGAVVIYEGERVITLIASPDTIRGVWRQLPRGVFGADLGTWEASDAAAFEP